MEESYTLYVAKNFKTRELLILLIVVSVGTALAIIRPDSDTFFLFGGSIFTAGASNMAEKCGWAAHNSGLCFIGSVQTVLGASISAVPFTGILERNSKAMNK